LNAETEEDNYTIVDGADIYQKDVKRLPQYVKQDLENQLEILKRDPFEGTEQLRGRYTGCRKKHLVGNYRFVFRIIINSYKIVPIEAKHRGPSYHLLNP
jgi:mRNA-degrading endonuclease RelE of RelBE toxin-antitoxin system